MSETRESNLGTIIILLIMLAALGFLTYMTGGYGGAFSLPMFLM